MMISPATSSTQEQQNHIVLGRRRCGRRGTMRLHRLALYMAIVCGGMKAIGATMAFSLSSPPTLSFSSSSSSVLLKQKDQHQHHQHRQPLLGSGEPLASRKSMSVARITNFALSAAASAAASSTASASTAAMSDLPSIISSSNLAVSLDRPLLSPIEYTYRSTAPPSSSSTLSMWWSSFLTVLLSDVLKTALIATLLAIAVSYLPKLVFASSSGTAAGYRNNNILSPVVDIFDSIYQRVKTVTTTILSRGSTTMSKKKKTSYTTPMPFEGDGGWGKCTLRSKKVLGSSSSSTSGSSSSSSSSQTSSSSFTVYEFALPESYYTIPLTLGQQLEFCCLSSNDDICTGSFYPLDGGDGDGGHTNAGVVRVVLPNDKMADEGNSKFMEVLRNELRPGDEVAIKPGKSHLTYNGKHVPVTDMVYLAYGLGIIPILDQVRAILPKGSSSVKVSSVTWFNDNRQDFDIAMDDLEKEYMKNPNKLAVSCIMEDVLTHPIEGNKEVEESVPYFNAGTMAVVAGPKRFAEKAKGYLMRRGYPENCICVLP